MHPPCRSHTPGAWARFASPCVDTLDDAVFVVEASVGGAPSFGAVALLLDGDDRLLTAIECGGCDSAERVLELASMLAEAAAGAPSTWRRMVLASSCDAPVDAWSAAVDVVAPAPVELVDWLLVDLRSGVVRSLRKEAGGRSPW